ncbi:hypothetical protein C8F01DRAFT_799094 [Mycena amicta]|nr:hypothetical protein C8F01DRAFT_799094 [Mycena amicta]
MSEGPCIGVGRHCGGQDREVHGVPLLAQQGCERSSRHHHPPVGAHLLLPGKGQGTRVIKPLPVRRNRNTIGNPTASTSTAVPQLDVEMTEAPVAKPPNSVYPRSAWPACEDVDTRFTGIKQLDIRDVDGSIIPPWQMAEKLKPGTLVRTTATPVCWIFVSDSYVDKKYALIIKSLQIIASVETEEEEHVRSPAAIAKAAGKRKADDDDSDDEGGTFQSFGSSPAKKVRV